MRSVLRRGPSAGVSPASSGPTRRARHRVTAWPHPALTLVLALVLAEPGRAAEPTPPRAAPASPPIWTTVPTRVDRSEERRERIDPPVADRPVAMDRVTGARGDGTDGLHFDGRRHRLFGLVAIDADRICTDADGGRWACGLRARSTLSGLAAETRLRCRGIGDATIAVPVVDCRLGERSLSERLVRDGLADLDAEGLADPALAAAREIARRARRGIWAAAPRP